MTFNSLSICDAQKFFGDNFLNSSYYNITKKNLSFPGPITPIFLFELVRSGDLLINFNKYT